ncbi:hypothetical protein R1sor_007867 [Riccia sorocarpa]|uniref:Uncharacterized protein n=1 Tax=Riccia sorocarpa TaxID=122646 RepID=A0ABD3HTE9_9MARC
MDDQNNSMDDIQEEEIGAEELWRRHVQSNSGALQNLAGVSPEAMIRASRRIVLGATFVSWKEAMFCMKAWAILRQRTFLLKKRHSDCQVAVCRYGHPCRRHPERPRNFFLQQAGSRPVPQNGFCGENGRRLECVGEEALQNPCSFRIRWKLDKEKTWTISVLASKHVCPSQLHTWRSATDAKWLAEVLANKITSNPKIGVGQLRDTFRTEYGRQASYKSTWHGREIVLSHMGGVTGIESQEIQYVSDRCKGIINAVRNIFPGASHVHYTIHLQRNVKQRFGTEMEKFFKVLHRCKTEERYKQVLEAITEKNSTCGQYLSNIPPALYVMYVVRRPRFGHTTSNIVEIANSAILPIKSYGPLRMCIELYLYMMEQKAKQHRLSLTLNEERLTPYAAKYMATQEEDAGRMRVRIASLNEALVQSSTRDFIVTLIPECNMFSIQGHVLALQSYHCIREGDVFVKRTACGGDVDIGSILNSTFGDIQTGRYIKLDDFCIMHGPHSSAEKRKKANQ